MPGLPFPIFGATRLEKANSAIKSHVRMKARRALCKECDTTTGLVRRLKVGPIFCCYLKGRFTNDDSGLHVLWRPL